MQNLKGEQLLRELERRANDEIEVINPTLEDFVVDWEGQYFVIPNTNRDGGYGKGKRVVPRYIAEYYFKHMTDKLINLENDAKLAKEKEAFAKRGEYFGVKEQQIALKTNDKELRRKHLKTLYGGVKREFGRDEIPEAMVKPQQRDSRSLDQQLLDELEPTKQAESQQPDDFISQIEEK